MINISELKNGDKIVALDNYGGGLQTGGPSCITKGVEYTVFKGARVSSIRCAAGNHVLDEGVIEGYFDLVPALTEVDLHADDTTATEDLNAH